MTHILVLEDDPDLRNLYTRALRFRGYDVSTADSAELAISMLKNQDVQPDVAVLDMSMPGLPGSAVVEYIRYESDLSDMPIIVISCDESFRQILHDLHVLFMTKPINLADLYNAVSEMQVT